MVERAARRGVPLAILATTDLLLRHAAARMGGSGSLRGPIALSTTHRPNPTQTIHPWPEARLVEALAWFGIEAEARPTRGGILGRAARSAASGVTKETVVAVTGGARGKGFVLSVPDRPDLLPEAVAMAADTGVAVQRRFPVHAGAIRRMSFDRSARGLIDGRIGGLANQGVQVMHLNVGYVAEAPALDLRRVMAEATSGASAGPTSARPSGPFTIVDKVVAHECWHLVEMSMQTRTRNAHTELRRLMGEHLGVGTLERAFRTGAEGDEPAALVARRRILEEVSPYAATMAVECTAELFACWWCRGPQVSPLVATFGGILDRLFPPAR